MMFYTTAINAVFAVLIAAALFMTQNGVSNTFLLNLLFYVIFTPIMTVTLTKIMFSSENQMIVADALERIDSVMTLTTMKEPVRPSCPKDNSVVLDCVSFRYQNTKANALNRISLQIKPGEHVALVGPSGGGKTTLASVIARFWDVSSGRIMIAA